MNTASFPAIFQKCHLKRNVTQRNAVKNLTFEKKRRYVHERDNWRPLYLQQEDSYFSGG